MKAGRFKRVVVYLEPNEYLEVKRFLASRGVSCSEWIRRKFSFMVRYLRSGERKRGEG